MSSGFGGSHGMAVSWSRSDVKVGSRKRSKQRAHAKSRTLLLSGPKRRATVLRDELYHEQAFHRGAEMDHGIMDFTEVVSHECEKRNLASTRPSCLFIKRDYNSGINGGSLWK